MVNRILSTMDIVGIQDKSLFCTETPLQLLGVLQVSATCQDLEITAKIKGSYVRGCY